MSKTVVIKLPLACAGQVCAVLKKRMEKIVMFCNTESAEDNYIKGAEYAYLDNAVSVIEEAISEC